MADGSKKKPVLQGHKRKGSRYIPPMLQLPGEGITEISYVDQILPQGLWMGLINEQLGYRNGIELNAAICQNACELRSTEQHVNFSLVSNFGLLTDEQKTALMEDLDRCGTLESYRTHLAPLIHCYDDFPLGFLGEPDDGPDRSELISTLKTSVQNHFDRYESPAMVLQANIVYVRGMNGGLFLPETMDAPDLNAIIEDPESEGGKRAGGFVRTSVMMEFMPVEGVSLDAWASSFWNTNYELDDCDFSWEENADL
jgi:hypothetical protein